ncbi:hypothetical protein M5689_014860 [Euphorbia peplus]|nr:hypothetical protein M5689_014860 [Euphorbia peplus]
MVSKQCTPSNSGANLGFFRVGGCDEADFFSLSSHFFIDSSTAGTLLFTSEGAAEAPENSTLWPYKDLNIDDINMAIRL